MYIVWCAAPQCVGEYRNFLHLKNALAHLLGRVDLSHFLECKSCALNLFNAIMEKRKHSRKSTILVCIFMRFSFAEEKISYLIFFPFWSLFIALYIFPLLENCGEEEATDVNVGWVIFKIRLYWMESRFQNVWGCVIIVSQFCVYFNFFLRMDEMEW